MDLNALKAAVLGAGTATAPAASPNSTGANAFVQSAIGNIQNLASVGTRAQAANFAGNALYGGVKQQASVDASNEEAARQAAADAAKLKLEELQQTATDIADPKKYTRTTNNSGGYDFYAPDGTKITAQDYAKVQGKHVTEILKGSQNTKDQQFLQDYDEIKALGAASQQGGDALQKYLKKNPDIKKQLDDNKLNNYADVVKNFRSAYPEFFPQAAVKDIGNAPNNSAPLQPKPTSFIDRLKSLF